ncbi:DJ-1/PfpI family protein [Streptomyces virginiae]|uniref:DJ-1/PfpI family protein n=1 Tax=Streptomyces virginiae TaxID=1961 RepID=UPI003252FBF7
MDPSASGPRQTAAGTEPWKAVLGAGWNPQPVSTKPGRVQAFHHLDKAGTHPVDRVLASRTAESFDALVLPGGVADPDALRMIALAVEFTRGFFESAKPVAAICHAAPATLVTSRKPADLDDFCTALVKEFGG